MFRFNSKILHNFVQTLLHILYGKIYLRQLHRNEIGMKITRYTQLETSQQLVLDCRNRFHGSKPFPILATPTSNPAKSNQQFRSVPSEAYRAV